MVVYLCSNGGATGQQAGQVLEHAVQCDYRKAACQR